MTNYIPENFEKKDLPFSVKRLSPSIGGEINGIDLTSPIDDITKDLIYEALNLKKKIVFR